jgi:hypothetical protein
MGSIQLKNQKTTINAKNQKSKTGCGDTSSKKN